MTKKILISAGELSGDQRAAELVEQLKLLSPDIEILGMGGRFLRSQNVKTIVDSESSASVMGFRELLSSFRQVLEAFNLMKKAIKKEKADLLVLIDYPDFNLRLAKKAKQEGLPVLYYITPKLWAWRKGRVDLFKRYIDCALVIFPFEEDFFKRNSYQKSIYVGHPFAEDPEYKVLNVEERAKLRKRIGIGIDDKVLCIFPGSRKQEIERHLNLSIEVFRNLKERHAELKAFLCVAPNIKLGNWKESVKEIEGFNLYFGDPVELMHCSDAGLIKSGTSNLQAAFCELPFVMFYKTSLLSEFIARLVVKLREYSIVNIIKSGTIREFIQKEATLDNLSEELERLLYDEQSIINLKNKLIKVKEALLSYSKIKLFEDSKSASHRAALVVNQFLRKENI